MAQALQNIAIQAPAFQGINTEDSPLAQDPTFSQRANNAVLDSLGRLGSRKGFRDYASSWDFSAVVLPQDYSQYDIKIHSMSHSEGVKPIIGLSVEFYSLGRFSIGKQYFFGFVDVDTRAVKVAEIPSPYAVEATVNGSIVPFNGESNTNYYIFGSGAMMVADPVKETVEMANANPAWYPPQDDNDVFSDRMDGTVACAAYGRIWVSGVKGDYQRIYYSSLENPYKWYDGTAAQAGGTDNTGGIIEVSQYWPNGVDQIRGIIAHNNMLVVFGRNSILMYGNPQGDPAAVGGIYLQDTVDGMGLVSRDAVCSNGADVLFVDDSGVRSLGRSIQEQSVAIGDLTANVRTEIKTLIAATTDKAEISLTYWPQEGLVICNFDREGKGYILDQRKVSSSGGSRVTTWSEISFDRSLHVEQGDKTLVLLGSSDGLGRYEGYVDGTNATYQMSYVSNPLTFGDSVREKFPKRYDLTIATRNTDTEFSAQWGVDGSLQYSKRISANAQTPGLYFDPDDVVEASFEVEGLALFGAAEYGRGDLTLKRYRVNTKGSGPAITLGVDASIKGGFFSIQELNIQTQIGRIY